MQAPCTLGVSVGTAVHFSTEQKPVIRSQPSRGFDVSVKLLQPFLIGHLLPISVKTHFIKSHALIKAVAGLYRICSMLMILKITFLPSVLIKQCSVQLRPVGIESFIFILLF